MKERKSSSKSSPSLLLLLSSILSEAELELSSFIGFVDFVVIVEDDDALSGALSLSSVSETSELEDHVPRNKGFGSSVTVVAGLVLSFLQAVILEDADAEDEGSSSKLGLRLCRVAAIASRMAWLTLDLHSEELNSYHSSSLFFFCFKKRPPVL